MIQNIIELLSVVEGETEEKFVKEILYPYFEEKELSLIHI